MEVEYKLKDFTDIYSLCSKRTESFSVIGDRFCEIFCGRDIVCVCLTLIASYKECESINSVTQRLIIVYLFYRLKEIGDLSFGKKDSNDLEIYSHPFLFIFVKIYSDFLLALSSTENNGNTAKNGVLNKPKSKGIIHFLENFPKITPQEAHFVGFILSDSFQSLKQLFSLSPAQVAELPASNLKNNVNITKQIEYVESQLDQLRFFGRESEQDNLYETKNINPLSIVDPIILNHYARIIYSLIPPPFVRIEPSVMPPSEGEFRFIYPSMLEPEQVIDDWLKDEEWNQEKMRSLEKSFPSLRLTHRYSGSSSPNKISRQKLDSEFNASLSLESTIFNPSQPNLTYDRFSRAEAIECLNKVISENPVPLTKVEITSLAATLAVDPDIFKDANITDSFTKLVEQQPDIAAELLVYELKHNSNDLLTIHFEALLNLEFSVQILVAVNKFISTCENKNLKIPNDFMNRFITFCMTSCEQNNANEMLTIHRLVRMVCVFFTTLIRLKNFDVKPRLTELQKFSTIFSSFKEASTLYQTIQNLN